MAKKIWVCDCHNQSFITYNECQQHETAYKLSSHLEQLGWAVGADIDLLSMLDKNKESIMSYYGELSCLN